MKKFFTYNGLFTGCPPIISQQNQFENENLPDENKTQNNETILHYPQENMDNTESNSQSFDTKIDNLDTETSTKTQNEENNEILSDKAKILLNCMQTHDRILRNFNK